MCHRFINDGYSGYMTACLEHYKNAVDRIVRDRIAISKEDTTL